MPRSSRAGLLFFGLLLFPGVLFAGVVAFLHVTLIDGTGAPARADTTVVVAGDRISAVGASAAAELPAGAAVIDAAGKYLIPGLWDMHVHTLRTGRPEAYFPLFIANGVVGVRDMGGDFSLDEIRRLKKEITGGARLGPQFIAPGPILDGPQPQLARISLAIRDAAAGRAAVQRLKQEGADFIKVFNGLPREAFFAIAAEAKRLNLPLAGHVPFSVSAREASGAGMKSMEHLFNILFACSSREGEFMAQKAQVFSPGMEAEARRQLRRGYLRGVLDSYDAHQAGELFRLFAGNGSWQAPTLVKRRAFALPDQNIAADPRLRYIPKRMRALWNPKQDRARRSRSAEDAEIERRYYEQDRAQLVPMLRAGVKILAGSDSGDPYTFPGFSLHDELALLVENGLTPMQALQAATKNAADFLGQQQDWGTVEAGRRADLVLLDANPLADIHNTRRIAGLLFGGKYLPREALDRLLADAAAAAAK